MDKTDTEVHKAFSMVYAELTDEEKASYVDVVEVSGGPKREEVVRQAGFRTFLRGNVPYVSTSLIMWLVENNDPSRYMLTLNGKKYKLSGSSFENIMGIKDGGESVEFQGNVDISDLKDTIIGDKLQISMADLEEQLEESQNADDLFIARFALVAIGSVLCPPSGVHLSSSYLYAVKLLNSGKEESPLCPLEDAKKQKRRIENEAETRNALIIEVKQLVESVISQRLVRTKEDDNVMNIDEGENIVEAFVGKIRKSCGTTSKAKRAVTSKGKRGVDESDKGTPKGKQHSSFEEGRQRNITSYSNIRSILNFLRKWT
ncbi:hypothetical protein TorRG33x02_340100 [Trema orientale]|uniref:Uncharacterized protein n=1 Tax=Trema orientale TaxID=63057 RepID=A0A2P5AVJ4_TREOI|nr:hypothetical protein TorRG33x02_340100 [Trema orientale]